MDNISLENNKIGKVFNLTQHPATADQLAAGVIEPEPALKERIKELLTFDAPPSYREMTNRAADISDIAAECGCEFAMIGGAPFFMSTLEAALWRARQVTPIYAYSQRINLERIQPDGSVTKHNIFKHAGWVEAPHP